MKPGALTDEERAVIQRHPIDGAELLAGFRHLAEAAKIIRAHHERPDGAGYPDGLRAAEISFGASIVSVVDAWDAMVSDRPYRDGMPTDQAEAILRKGVGTQWCETAVELALKEIHDGGIAQPWRLERVGRVALARGGGLAVDSLAGCLPEHLTSIAKTPSFDGAPVAAGAMRGLSARPVRGPRVESSVGVGSATDTDRHHWHPSASEQVSASSVRSSSCCWGPDAAAHLPF